MNQNDRSKSPFSELSFSQQQDQWRISRARFASAAAAQP